VHYRQIADHSAYQKRFGWAPEEWPNAKKISQQTVSLPLSPKMSDSDVGDVIEAVRGALNRQNAKRVPYALRAAV